MMALKMILVKVGLTDITFVLGVNLHFARLEHGFANYVESKL